MCVLCYRCETVIRYSEMFVVGVTLLIYAVHVVTVNSWYDLTGKPHKWIVRYLGTELMADAMLKVRQTVDIRKEHSRFLSFEIGFLIGQIRERYRFMMELYRLCLDRYIGRTRLSTPLLYSYHPVDYFQKYEYMHLLEVEIDKMVEVLERMYLDDIVPYPILYENALRTRTDDGDSEEEKHKALEEAVKSRYREEYLMRKLNSPGQTTTKKRFVLKWPVPGTWSLEAY